MNNSVRIALSVTAVATLIALSACSVQDTAPVPAPVTTASAPSVRPSSQQVYYIECDTNPVVEPKSLDLDCTKGGLRLSHLDWTQWGHYGASGSGYLIGTPADLTDGGRFAAILAKNQMDGRVAVTVSLQSPRAAGENARIFSGMVVHIVGTDYGFAYSQFVDKETDPTPKPTSTPTG